MFLVERDDLLFFVDWLVKLVDLVVGINIFLMDCDLFFLVLVGVFIFNFFMVFDIGLLSMKVLWLFFFFEVFWVVLVDKYFKNIFFFFGVYLFECVLVVLLVKMDGKFYVIVFCELVDYVRKVSIE